MSNETVTAEKGVCKACGLRILPEEHAGSIIHNTFSDCIQRLRARVSELESAYNMRDDEVTGLMGMNAELRAAAEPRGSLVEVDELRLALRLIVDKCRPPLDPEWLEETSSYAYNIASTALFPKLTPTKGAVK